MSIVISATRPGGAVIVLALSPASAGLLVPGAEPIDLGMAEIGVSPTVTRRYEVFEPGVGVDGGIGLHDRVAVSAGAWLHAGDDELAHFSSREPISPWGWFAVRALAVDRPRVRFGAYAGAIGESELGRLPRERPGCREAGFIVMGGVMVATGTPEHVQWDLSLGAPAAWRAVRTWTGDGEDNGCDGSTLGQAELPLMMVSETGVRFPLPRSLSVRVGLMAVVVPTLELSWNNQDVRVDLAAAYLPPLGGGGNVFHGQVRVGWRRPFLPAGRK